MSPFWLTTAAMALAASYLIPNHYLPWLAFHGEFVAASAMVPVVIAVLFQAKKIFSTDLFWLGAFCLAVVLAQRVFGVVDFNGIAVLTCLYLVGAMSAAITGGVWQIMMPRQPELYLGTAFLIAGILSLPIAVMQWLGSSWETAYLVMAPSLRPTANIAQPNLLADLFLLGVCGTLRIWQIVRQIRPLSILLFVLAGLLSMGTALCGSRTAAVSVLVLSAIMFWQAPRHRMLIPGRLYVVLLCVIFFGVLIAAPSLQRHLQEAQEETLIFSAASSQSRLATWEMMSKALLTSPWSGFGWQQILKVNFVFERSMGMESGMFGQSHNLFLDLMLWMGIPLGVLASISCLVLLRRSLYQGQREGRWAACGMVLILAIHALVEYPLQYAYFLLPFALLIGSLQSPQAIFPKCGVNRYFAFLSLCIAVALLVAIERDYIRIEKAFYALRYEAKGYLTSYPKDEPKVWLLDHLAEHIRISRMDPSIPVSEAELAHRDSVTRVTPGPYIIVQLAKTYAYHDNHEREEFWLRQLCVKFSTDACRAGQQWWMRPDGPEGKRSQLGPWPLSQSQVDEFRGLHAP